MIKMAEQYNISDIPLTVIVLGLLINIGDITENERTFIFD